MAENPTIPIAISAINCRAWKFGYMIYAPYPIDYLIIAEYPIQSNQG
jgi:hypothetical protein